MRQLTGLLRLQRYLACHGRPVAIVLIVVGVGALGAAGFLYVEPGTEEITEQRGEQTIAAEATVSAPVVENASLWSPGTTLRDRPAYLLSESPELRIERHVGVTGGQLRQVDARYQLVFRAERDDETFWSRQRTLEADQEADDDGVTTTTSVDVEEVTDRATEFEAALDRAGSLSVAIVFELDYRTDRYEGTVESTTPLVLDGNAFEYTPETTSDRRSTAATVSQPRARHWNAIGGLASLGATGLGGAVWIVSFLRNEPSPGAIGRRLERARYAEWISEGSLPDNGRYEWVPMDSLGDLVDYAIDTRGRVVFDREHRQYGVVDGRIIHYTLMPGAHGEVPTQLAPESRRSNRSEPRESARGRRSDSVPDAVLETVASLPFESWRSSDDSAEASEIG